MLRIFGTKWLRSDWVIGLKNKQTKKLHIEIRLKPESIKVIWSILPESSKASFKMQREHHNTSKLSSSQFDSFSSSRPPPNPKHTLTL